ncbi:MAG: YciI family protein [Thermoplasmata archaeon]
MEFDTFTVVLLEARPDAPALDEKKADALQDAHMEYLASLHEAGSLQAAGPFVSPPGSSIRGLSVHRLPPEEVRALLAKDPAVRAGKLAARIFTWMVPKGAVSFSPTRFPHSQAEV